jgi:acyl-CoA thioesterase
MDETVKEAITLAVKKEPFAQALKMELVDLEDGYSVVQMVYNPDKMDNIYSRSHGGAIYALTDEAFETAGQTDGTVAVALNVNITYVASPRPGGFLKAEAKRVSQTKKTAVYEVKVTDQDQNLIATSQALAYRTGKPIPFLEVESVRR